MARTKWMALFLAPTLFLACSIMSGNAAERVLDRAQMTVLFGGDTTKEGKCCAINPDCLLKTTEKQCTNAEFDTDVECEVAKAVRSFDNSSWYCGQEPDPAMPKAWCKDQDHDPALPNVPVSCKTSYACKWENGSCTWDFQKESITNGKFKCTHSTKDCGADPGTPD
jgi:hypothetical protein